MSAEEEYRTDAERLGDLLDKATSGPDPEVSCLTPEEEDELQELWDSAGLTEELGPYDHPERWVNAASTPGVIAPPPPDEESPRPPPPPAMTWEEIEDGKAANGTKTGETA